jgi:hypothetical protein
VDLAGGGHVGVDGVVGEHEGARAHPLVATASPTEARRDLATCAGGTGRRWQAAVALR